MRTSKTPPRIRQFVAFLAGLFLSFSAGLSGCASSRGPGDAVPDPAPDPAFPASTAPCDPADPDPAGPACAWLVATDAEFDRLSIGPTGVLHWTRATKYMVPARDDDSLVPGLVQNSNRYPMHMEFLAETVLPGLQPAAYAALVTQRATRQYYAGNLVRIEEPGTATVYGFTVYTAAAATEQLEPVEVRRVYESLKDIVTAGPLAYTFEPYDAVGPMKAAAWIDPGFPIRFLAHQEVDVEVYTPGTAYGRVRRFALPQFESASLSGLLGWRDLVVVDSVPFDLDSVVAGLVTGGRQWELGHVSVRLAHRGTPNLYVRDALAAFAAWDGQLVRLDAMRGSGSQPDSWTATVVTQAEAETWWATHRPAAPAVPPIDRSCTDLVALDATAGDGDPVMRVSCFGGKATQLARLYAFLDPRYRVPGFGIPFAPFEDFLDTTPILDPRVVPAEEVSLREYVHRLAGDPAVAQDAFYRKALLAGLRDWIAVAGQIPPGLVTAVADRISVVMGGPGTAVRFRSSSNLEDSLVFPGAGLYDSTTVCAADSLDGDTVGPSACNPDQDQERTVERGLRRVWASLYNDRAWDERDWYQVPQEAAGMAVLVTQAFPDEQANGVIFTGDPGDATDPRYLVNAQVGDEPVVTNDPAKVPEADRLVVESGQVIRIDRVRGSTLALPGVPVLSDAKLQELGALLASIDAVFEVDLEGHPRTDVLLDVEFKLVKGTEQLKIKQIRPFLRSGTER